MPVPQCDPSALMSNTLIVEQLDFNKEILAQEFISLQNTMTNEQRIAFDEIMHAIDTKKGGFFFLNGYGGTGKTFLWHALTANLRSKGEIVLCVASSGIAATLLPDNSTLKIFHPYSHHREFNL
ncbi:hypothetical protein RIF29_19380 [Crotalaria pallida]|uniref:ATP-dependent DNA helicase n=1 Tax=Crotalaria pallida TaxID=3830 RepID=A0AAN9EZE5_CROPI